MDPSVLSAVLESWGYVALLGLLLVTGLGSPVPEDLLLVAAGYLTFAGVFQWLPVFIVSWCGVVLSDLMLYMAGRQLARFSARWSDDHFLSPARVRMATRWFDKWGDSLVLAARLAPGTRAVVFVTAGLRSVPVRRFLAFDAAGALLWVPAMLIVGRTIGRRVGDVSALTTRMEQGALWVTTFAAVLLVIWLVFGREESKL
jgi:membrane protein DedA with SNARE-associated domain